jgi:hypothetical protein
MIRFIAVLCLAFTLGGCDRVRVVLMTAAEKVNLAFPLSAELTAAHSNLVTAAATDKNETQRIAEQFNQLLTVRAVTCTGTTKIGRFDTPSDIRQKLPDFECFKKQEAVLVEWVGLQRFAMTLRKPALRPLTVLPAKAIIPSAENSVTMAVARAANVAVVKSGSGKFTVVDLSGGKPINSFQAPGEAHRFAAVAPNGHMLAVPISNRSLTVFELESGSILWATDKYSDLVAWIPGIDAIILNETGGSKAILMDLRTGRVEPVLPSERNLNWALTMPGGPNQQLVGSQNSVSLVDFSRGVDGNVSMSVTKQWRLNGAGASSLTPMLMLNGKFLAFISNRDLGWLNLETGQQGLWAMSALNANGFIKLDESRILFSDSKRGSYTPTQKLLDVERQTVSTVQDISATEGYWLPFTPRSGLARSLNSAVVIHTTAQADNPMPLDQLLSEANLDAQLAKLQAQAAAATQSSASIYEPAEIAAANAASAAAGAALAAAEAAGRPKSDRQAYLDLLGRQVRAANVVNALRDGLPRDVVEQIRSGSRPQVTASVGGLAANAPAPVAFKPLLTDVPANAKVAMIGVYQAKPGVASTPGSTSHPVGGIRVNVESGSTPVVLVLASYEPVRWNVQNPSGRKIAAILLSGYLESSVMGLANVKVLKIGSNYAYKLGSPEYERLKTDVSRYISNTITSFQGRYEGQEFAVSD